MAKTWFRTSTYTTSGKTTSFYLGYEVTSQSIANNTSTIAWDVQYDIAPASGSPTQIQAGNVTAKLNGTTIKSVSGQALRADGYSFGTGSLTVEHSADGTKSIAWSLQGASYQTSVNCTGSGTITLPKIARVSVPTLSTYSCYIGDAITVYTNRASSSFNHTVYFYVNGGSQGYAALVEGSYTWAIPAAVANCFPNTDSGVCTVYCDTYSGNTYIGQSSVSFTIYVPGGGIYGVSISSATAKEAISGIATQIGALVQHQSQLALGMSATPSYGSSISAYSMTTNGQTIPSYSGTTNPLTTAGTNVISYSATDSRGRWITRNDSVSVLAYAPPQITSLAAKRVNSAGTDNDQGTYMKVTVSAVITALNSRNTKQFTLRYKKVSASSWSSVNITQSGYTLSGYTYTVSGVDTESAYNVEILAADYFGSTAYSVQLPTAFTIMDFKADGKGVAFGKVASVSPGVDFAKEMPLYYDGKPLKHIIDSYRSSSWNFDFYSDGTMRGYLPHAVWSSGRGTNGLIIDTAAYKFYQYSLGFSVGSINGKQPRFSRVNINAGLSQGCSTIPQAVSISGNGFTAYVLIINAGPVDVCFGVDFDGTWT